MNSEMLKGIARWLLTLTGGLVAGWFASKGWFTVDQVTSVINSPTAIGIVVALLSLVWNVISKTLPNLAATVVAVIPNTKVVTAPEVAAAVPGNAVVSNTDAKVVSK